MTEYEFLARKESRFFSFAWQAHGCWYGISREVELWLQRGRHVLINGSRHAYALARERFMPCQGILIQADPDIIRARLEARGREDAHELARRLERNADLNLSDKNVMVIWNNCRPELSGAQLVQAIHQSIQATEMCISSAK